VPLAEPPASLDGFPAVQAASSLYRIHRRGLSPLHFSDTGHGRFDLGPPEGTLYASSTKLGSFIEVFRSTLVPMAEVEQRELAELRTASIRLADCTARTARRFGVTAAIHSTPDYALTQGWAAAFRRAGFDGILYLLSHDPSASVTGVAIFGPDEAKPLLIHSDGPIEEELIFAAQESFGIVVVPAPAG